MSKSIDGGFPSIATDNKLFKDSLIAIWKSLIVSSSAPLKTSG